MLLINRYSLCCLRCTRAGYVSCINHSPSVRYGEVDPSDSQNLLYLDNDNDGNGPRHAEGLPFNLQNLFDSYYYDGSGDGHRYAEVDPSDLQNLLDLDYPRDKEFIAEHNLLDRWRKHQLLNRYDNKRADSGETFQCDAYYRDCTVAITQHTLDGMTFYAWVLV
jgi:hypothetical protein